MFRDFRFSFLGLAATVALSGVSSTALAYDFQPMVAEFAPSGPGATRSFVIRNTQQAPIALQIESFKRSQGADGAEVRTPDEDFLITPPQIVVPPGASQNVRAQWIGGAPPKKELAYRFIVKQLPISYQTAATNTDKTASVAIGYTYEAAVYVTPPGAKPGARLVGVAPVTGPMGEKLLRVTLESTGNTRAIIDKPKLSLRPQSGGAVELTADQLKPMENFVVLVDTQRSIDLPWPEKVPFGPVSAEFSSDYYDVS